MSNRESCADDRSRLSKFSNDIRKYESSQGADDFSKVVGGALHAQHTSDRAEQGSGYPRRYPK